MINGFLDQIDSELQKIYASFKNKKILIYGAGGYGKRVIRLLIKYNLKDNIIAICDSNPDKWNKEIYGKKVMNIKSIKFDEPVLAIIASECKKEIYEILKNYPVEIYKEVNYQKFMEEKMSMYYFKEEAENRIGFNLKWFDEWKRLSENKELDISNIINSLSDEKSKLIIENRIKFYCSGDINYIYNISVDNSEYFDEQILDLSDNEIFVDCGSYIGDTIESFLENVRNYRKIYAFEPDQYNYYKLKEKFGKEEKIILYNCGVGKENATLSFSQDGNMWSSIDDTGNVEVKIKRMDNIIDEKVTMIKMDIEGSELSALEGAQNIIKKYKPQLVICIYHKIEDIVTIPAYIKRLVPEYKLYIRQYDDTLFQTVLYAVI